MTGGLGAPISFRHNCRHASPAGSPRPLFDQVQFIDRVRCSLGQETIRARAQVYVIRKVLGRFGNGGGKIDQRYPFAGGR